MAAHRVPVSKDSGQGPVALWLSQRTVSRLTGLSHSLKRVRVYIDTSSNGCYGPTGIKVDHRENLFVACNSNSACKYGSQACQGEVQTYAPGATTPEASYSDYSPGHCGKHNHCWSYASPNDVAFDTQGHIFTANLTTTSCKSKPRQCAAAGGGYSWWEQGTSKPAHIEAGNGYDEVFNYLDVDDSGNLYIDATASLGSGASQVFEITNPTSASWKIATIIPATSDQLGGIYVSNAGAVLNVVDETTRTISQYALPWITGEAAFNVLGPTELKKNEGKPVSGGFNVGDSRLALGDQNDTFDLGFVAPNRWTRSGHKKLSRQPVFGAAFVPSDK